MTTDRLRRIEEVYHGALECDPLARKAYLDGACAGDNSLREAVESLLNANNSLPDLLAGVPENLLTPGTHFGPYVIEGPLGAGGMGEVYRATDTRLRRTVAIKVLPAHLAWNPDMRQRFEREAKMLSSLNHPNICTLYDVGRHGDADYLVMEYVAGETLAGRIPKGGMPLTEAASIAGRIAAALACAHRAGIVHRDLKPANVMVTADGAVKVMDFGLAKSLPWTSGQSQNTRTMEHTKAGAVMGTGSYMSPEQAEGKTVDARSDVFAFGALLYEMLTGNRAFHGDTLISTISAVLKDTPPAMQKIRGDLDPSLAAMVNRCLSKDRDARFASGAELEAALAPVTTHARIPRWKIAVAAAVLLALVGAGVRWGIEQRRVRWVYNTAIPEVHRLCVEQKYLESYELAMRARRILPNDRSIEPALNSCSIMAPFRSEPAGARLYYKPYLEKSAKEEFLGETPATLPTPIGTLRVRLVKAGYEDGEGSVEPGTNAAFSLDRKGERPAAMVSVPKGSRRVADAEIELPAYWLDRYEVSNRDFQNFVNADGYRKREYWTVPFRKEGREISWEEGMRLLVDPSGRPGPATWELGTYRENQGDYPVGGVSWYEAAAYANFVKKSLPTVAHWQRAAGFGQVSDILKVSNFDGQGPAPSGKYTGLGPFGHYDMAGNVKEWCSNAVGESRAILGGAWDEAPYRFRDFAAADPMERLPTDGFRCAKFRQTPSAAALAPIRHAERDTSKETPAGDETFRMWRNSYAYDATPLAATVEFVNDSSPFYREEKVSFAAAYPGERVTARLFLPKNSPPPYETVIYYPSAESTFFTNSNGFGEQRHLQFLMRSGRALLHPVYEGTYERIRPHTAGPNAQRRLVIQRLQDFRRSIDYLETRKDIDTGKLAYYGISMGCQEGNVMVSMEPRLRAAILAYCGIPTQRLPDGLDPLDLAPRIKVPTLLLEARDDLAFPYSTSALPLFHLLGSPEKDKKMVLRQGGHILAFPPETFREILGWLDRYLGPVQSASK